ncbi:MAG: glyoxylase-like metal-dependent hydrolase (beta-lactamase superfamily II) [Natronomonas sp.]|jgi:glyoxylase-like metal-dependent hydrolase (beta-lactamase superfamily II)|uniref:MBL fold metallo-hydrolase n=1 Tax=Natronomonas sp. TaxID=2184060 RepID=UPI003989F784
MRVLTFGNHEFEGQNSAYLLTDGDLVTLVDTGIAVPTVRDEFTAGLDEQNLGFKDIDQIVLTHWHPDHTGLAGDIQAQSDATVYVHEADAPLVTRDATALRELEARQRELFETWGMPQEKRDELLPFLSTEEIVGRTPDVEPLSDGATIDIGDRTLEVLHAPGHTDGLCCFAFDGDHGPEAFVGDAVLPKYTPNVGGADVRVEEPLAKYLDTLESLAERSFDRVWPGHRDVIEAPTERAREIIEHHRERAKRVIDILDDHGPADAWTVSDHLFGDLEGIHILHGPGEAYAHLDHLERHGLVEHTASGYRAVATHETVGDVV